VSFPDGAPPSTVWNMVHEFGATVPAGLSPNAVLSVYPTQLYEVVLGFFMFLVLWRLRDHKHAEGWLFGVYMILAGLERFAIEFWRAKDDRNLVYGLTYAQGIALLFVVAGVAVMTWRSRITDGKRGIYATGMAASA